MTAGTLVLLRHGRTPWNVAGRLQGQAEVDLDEVGVAQAAAVAQALATLQPSAIVSSDLRRAADTAAALSAASGVAVTHDQRLRERAFGKWEGLTHAQLQRDWPEEYPVWVAGGVPDGIGAESRSATGVRVATAITEHAQQLGPDDSLVVVTHGAAISAGISCLLGMDPDSWHGISGVANCHWSELQPTRSGKPQWRVFRHDIGA
ncbi:MAG: histidine phosphatase family protein [Beutenbergiaceae bacterium]